MSQATRILIALVAGLAVGIFMAASMPVTATTTASWVAPIGTLWLNALQMTVVPLVVALLVTGIAATAEAARAGRLAARAIITFIVLLWISSALGALLAMGLLHSFPLAESAREALRASFSGAKPVGDIPGFGAFVTAMVPTNPIAAAANDAFLPLIIFTTVFAFAVTRLPTEPRETLTRLFQAIADTMLVMINWVLWLAPIGVAALAYRVGATTGTAAVGALIHYVLIVSAVGLILSLIAYPLAAMGGIPLGRFIRTCFAPQAVAISTQSSLASLPAMLRAAEQLNLPVSRSGVVLPMAVAIFRFTGPCMNIAVAVYIAHIFGVSLGPGQVAAGVAAAAITTMGAVSLPGQVSFISSIAPIAIAMGLPIEPLALLVAVEMLPDLTRTVGNVTMDVAVTAHVAKLRDGDEAILTEADTIASEGA